MCLEGTVVFVNLKISDLEPVLGRAEPVFGRMGGKAINEHLLVSSVMPTFPIPVFSCAILSYLLVAMSLRGDGNWVVRTLVGFCALQALIISLAQHYGLQTAQTIQPIVASTIPPLAFLAFASLNTRPLDLKTDAWHICIPAFTAFCVRFAPIMLDVVIPAVFVVYAIAIIIAARGGADGLVRARLESGDLPAVIWRVLAGFLMLSALSDVLIGLDFLFGAGTYRPAILSVMSSLILLALGIVSLSRAQDAVPPEVGEPARPTSDVDLEHDRDLILRLNILMSERGLYRDPDLTLAKLARRLTVPAKTLSAAINRTEGRNVSQFVNAFRVHAACEHLSAGDSVTTAMLDSGFRTKSNFNREFQRVMRQSPSAWIASPATSTPTCDPSGHHSSNNP